MKNKTNKRAFTIVELVIVIAVIAVLAGVLIPTFSSLVKKAQTSKDTQLIRNLNTALVVDKTSGNEHNTMTDALKAAKEAGYDVSKINASNTDNEILWDSVNDVFCYLEKDTTKPSYIPETTLEKEANDVDYWKISNTVDTKYSTYLYGYTGTTVEATKGLDVGETEGITSITYTNSGNAQKVVIRTNGGSLSITDTNADSEQIHYGILSSAEVTTGTSCFYTHGLIGTMDLKAGKVVADKNGYVCLMKAVEGTQVVEQNGGMFVISAETTSDIPESVVGQLTGYSVSDGKIVADDTREQKSYYEIGSIEQLKIFRDCWNNGTITITKVKLTSDLDLSDSNWYPIGTWEFPYNGSFNGDGHTIKGLYANSTDADHKGLYANGDCVGFGETYGFFGIVGNGATVISNINFTNVNINIYDGKDVGAVIGYVPSNEKFVNAGKTDGFISYNKWDDNDSIGKHSLTLNDITVSGSVSGASHVAGLVGKIYTTGNIEFNKCINKATVKATGGYVGGLIGIQSSLAGSFELTNCSNEGDITTSTTNGVAGLVGRVNDNMNTDEATILNLVVDNCSNSGNINASNSSAAGLIFCNSVKSVLIKDCINTGNVTSSKGSACGIITKSGSLGSSITYEGTIKNSGNVSGIASASGIGLYSKSILKNTNILNEGAIQATNDGSEQSGNYAGGLADSFIGTITFDGTSSFENTGNISVTTVWGEAYAGGVFGKYSNSSEANVDFPLLVNVHNCSISGVGAGRWFHNTGYGQDVIKNDPVAVGGFAGRAYSMFVTYKDIKVDNVTFSALASETTKPYAPKDDNETIHEHAEPNVRKQFMAGSFVGIMNISCNTEVNNILENATLTNNTFDSCYKGIIVGCSYNSGYTTSLVILKYSGNFMNSTEVLSYNGLVYNNATIEELAE